MDRKFRFALIGCGKVSKKHLKAYADNKEYLEIVALVDTNPKAMEVALSSKHISNKERLSIKCYTEYQTMLEEQSPDIVAITTPSGTHTDIGLASIRKGASLLLEKPMTLSVEEADMLIEEASKYNVKIALGHIYRFFPFVEQIKKDIGDKLYGDVLYGDVKVHWGHDQAYYNQGKWRGTWAQDGGVLMNQSIHALDLMSWLMNDVPCEVVGMIARQAHVMEAEDLALGIIRFKSGSYCTVEGTTNSDPDNPSASFYILCTGGSIFAGIKSGKPFLDIRDSLGRKCRKKYIKELICVAYKNEGLLSLLKLGNPHSGIMRDLCQSIIENRSPRADGYSGRNSLELVLAIYKSALYKKPVELPLGNFSIHEMNGFFN